ncbi:MAG: sulfur carrier protein ThiS [Planctomycetia bacterium]|nr:sulfur carrier protein ThiS [Planctomycetia bacterium]
MKLLINGEEKNVGNVSTVAELLKFLNLEKAFVAVEVNRELVPKAQHLDFVLHDGDILEIVTLVGGG